MDYITKKIGEGVDTFGKKSGKLKLDLYDYMGTSKLNKDPHFELLHVVRKGEDDEDGPVSITLVTPASDRAIRKQVKAEGYYTLSHMWGNGNDLKPWTSHGVIGPDGNPLAVSMRPEKEQTVLQLLQNYPGFWWIDVFCARTDTPLVIMGDIYRCCSCCFALVDYESEGFGSVMKLQERLQSLESNQEIIQRYRQRVKGQVRGTTGFLWREFLHNLLDGWYDGCETDIEACANLFDCRWFARVWTLQELLLPPKLMFYGESSTTPYYINRAFVLRIMETARDLCRDALRMYMAEAFEGFSDLGFHRLTPEQHAYSAQAPGIARCYYDTTSLMAICSLFFFCRDVYLGTNSAIPISKVIMMRESKSTLKQFNPLPGILGTLASMPRICSDPCDYIYGVAGFLMVDIPRSKDTDFVWKSFKAIIDKRAPYYEIPDTVDLSSAVSMEDVYRPFSSGSPGLSDWAKTFSFLTEEMD